MTYPTAVVTTTNLDGTLDSPATARSDLLDAVQKLNQMIAHTTAFVATLLDDVDAAAFRATLAAAASGANADITSMTGLSNGGIPLAKVAGAAASGANANITSLTGIPGVTLGANAIGFADGAGGVVTQATSKSTAVTLDKFTGLITMHPSSIAADGAVGFACSCAGVTTGDIVVVNLYGGAAVPPNYVVSAAVSSSGVIGFGVKNLSTSALSEALQLKYAVFRATNI